MEQLQNNTDRESLRHWLQAREDASRALEYANSQVEILTNRILSSEAYQQTEFDYGKRT